MRSALLAVPLLSLALTIPVHAHLAPRGGEPGATGTADRESGSVGLTLRPPVPGADVDGGLPVEFTLLDASHARLELLDVKGRVVRAQHIGGLGPGRHTVDLSHGRPLAPGIYVLRIAQRGQEVQARTAVLWQSAALAVNPASPLP